MLISLIAQLSNGKNICYRSYAVHNAHIISSSIFGFVRQGLEGHTAFPIVEKFSYRHFLQRRRKKSHRMFEEHVKDIRLRSAVSDAVAYSTVRYVLYVRTYVHSRIQYVRTYVRTARGTYRIRNVCTYVLCDCSVPYIKKKHGIFRKDT